MDQVENVWIQAGGNPQAAAMAAAVADASSGLNPNATYTNPDGSVGVGLWLIDKSGMPPGSTDPVANARAAIQQSNNGTDWQQWCVAWSDNACGKNNGTYLGEGSNALGSLGGQFNIPGATPTGAGTSATSISSGTSTPTQTAPSGKGNIIIMLAALIGLSVLLFYINRKRRGEPATLDAPEETTIATE